MDDHVHVLLQPREDFTLSQITHSWKSFTANQINSMRKRTGTLWQKDSHQRIIRDEREFRSKLEYIIKNPQKRWAGSVEYQWVELFDLE